MRVVISAGGTGGHIYPALAIINKIKEMEPNSEFLYIGTTNRMEKDLIPSMGYRYEGIEVTGFKRKLTLDNFKTITNFLNAIKRCKIIIKDFDPDIVIGCGGYVTAPVIYAAKKQRVALRDADTHGRPSRKDGADRYEGNEGDSAQHALYRYWSSTS